MSTLTYSALVDLQLKLLILRYTRVKLAGNAYLIIAWMAFKFLAHQDTKELHKMMRSKSREQ